VTNAVPGGGQPEQPVPCKCHTSFAYISPTHTGHCCFVPATQQCHPEEVAAWERGRDRRLAAVTSPAEPEAGQ